MTTFIVKGTPKSIQAHSVDTWKEQVRVAAREAFLVPFKGRDLTVRIMVFYNKAPTFDTDNISKPIVDALIGIAYADDNQVMERNANRKKMSGSYRIKGAALCLATALAEGDDFVCIEVRKLNRREVEMLQ